MRTNADTAKVIDAVATVVDYCERYSDCHNCIFYNVSQNKFLSGCAINRPFDYRVVYGQREGGDE